jgi:hypothetical protein
MLGNSVSAVKASRKKREERISGWTTFSVFIKKHCPEIILTPCPAIAQMILYEGGAVT